jgi:TRAP-type uncharacterized transport system substrate-binding protein
MGTVAGPRIDREVTVRMMGDWGTANLHRICGWLGAEMWARCPPNSTFVTWHGRGGTDAIDALLQRRVDTALFVPASLGRNVVAGKGVWRGPGAERLRAIATLPQDDRLVFLVDAALGVRTLADVRQKRPALRIAAAVDDGVNMAGYATHRLLEAAGLPRREIEAWGGAFVEGEAPWDILPHAIEGRANAILFEAIMLPLWKDLLAKRRMNFIAIDADVLVEAERTYALPRGTVPADRFPGQTQAFETIDFSDFLLMCTDDLADDVAYLMAWCVCETTATIEKQYRHIPPKDSPLTYPLVPAKMARTSIPLHPGAARYYRDAKVLA